MGDYPHTRALRDGSISSTQLRLNLLDLAQVPHAISETLDKQAYDACEMPIVSYLQALAERRPVRLLPIAMVRRRQHAAAIYDSSHGEVRPDNLAGRRIGVRSWTRTTGVWVRGILAQDYGLDPGTVDWVTTQDSHLAPVHDPSRHAAPGKTIAAMLLDGEIDVAIGESIDSPTVRPLIADPVHAGQQWCESYGFVPINHMIVVRENLPREDPEVVGRLCSLLRQNWQLVGAQDPVDASTPFGIDANRAALEMVIGFAAEQGVIAERLSVAQLFDPTLLGPPSS